MLDPASAELEPIRLIKDPRPKQNDVRTTRSGSQMLPSIWFYPVAAEIVVGTVDAEHTSLPGKIRTRVEEIVNGVGIQRWPVFIQGWFHLILLRGTGRRRRGTLN